MKRILAIILFILVSIGIGYAIYVFFFRGPVAPGVNQPGENANLPVNGLPPSINGAPPPGVNVNGGVLPPTTGVPGVSPVADGGITAVVPIAATSTIGASISASGNISYYDRNVGKFYRIGPDGTATLLSNKQFFNVSAATFDPAGNLAIIEYPDGSNISYDFRSGTQVTLPRHWEDFGFDGSGTRIAAKSIGLDDTNKFLVVAGPDGSGARAVQELGANADKVIVAMAATGQVVATAATGRKLGADRQEIYLIGQNQENFKSLTVEGIKFNPKWTPSGKQLLYDVAGSASDWKPQLWVVDGQGDGIGQNRRSINLNTWVDKCAFADDRTLYCAVPKDMPRGAGLDPSVADVYADDLYRVDLETGLTSRIAVPEGNHTIGSVMIAPDRSSLYFTDKESGAINKIMLK